MGNFRVGCGKLATSLAQIAEFARLYKPYIEKSTPAPHVASEDDPRPPFTPGSEFDSLV